MWPYIVLKLRTIAPEVRILGETHNIDPIHMESLLLVCFPSFPTMLQFCATIFAELEWSSSEGPPGSRNPDARPNTRRAGRLWGSCGGGGGRQRGPLALVFM